MEPLSVERLDLRRWRGFARILSSSSTVYYVSSSGSGLALMRARGGGLTGHGPHDDVWVPLVRAVSGPRLVTANGRELEDSEIDVSDEIEGTLRVGSRHTFTYRAPDGRGRTAFSWTQRAATAIELWDDMPPEDARTRSAAEVDFGDGPSPWDAPELPSPNSPRWASTASMACPLSQS